jgi:hypothetical protein
MATRMSLALSTLAGLALAARPNVLLLLVDDMGYSDLPSFGSTNVSAPHITALVDSGVRLTQWISAAPICTPSRAALQTGRYPIRTGCMGDVERYRVIPTPSNPHGLDPATQTSIATALGATGYATGMSGKWHLGINSAASAAGAQDRRFTPRAHGYGSYLGAPWTNAPMCAMDGDGVSARFATGPAFCLMMANDTVVEQPLVLENFTRRITEHAVAFVGRQSAARPWLFLMAYFHVHTPLFTSRANRGRSAGGAFGDNVEELDDSVGALMGAVDRGGFSDNTIVFLTSDNGPYQEEGWAASGRTNLYDEAGGRVGRLKGGKGQLFEGGVRMPGAVVWPGVTAAGTTSDTLVSARPPPRPLCRARCSSASLVRTSVTRRRPRRQWTSSRRCWWPQGSTSGAGMSSTAGTCCRRCGGRRASTRSSCTTVASPSSRRGSGAAGRSGGRCRSACPRVHHRPPCFELHALFSSCAPFLLRGLRYLWHWRSLLK